MLEKLKPYAKATAGGLIAGLSALAPLMDDGVSAKDWVLVAVAALSAAVAVYWVPYKPAQ